MDLYSAVGALIFGAFVLFGFSVYHHISFKKKPLSEFFVTPERRKEVLDAFQETLIQLEEGFWALVRLFALVGLTFLELPVPPERRAAIESWISTQLIGIFGEERYRYLGAAFTLKWKKVKANMASFVLWWFAGIGVATAAMTLYYHYQDHEGWLEATWHAYAVVAFIGFFLNKAVVALSVFFLVITAKDEDIRRKMAEMEAD